MATTAGDRQAKDALFDGFASVARALSSGRRAEIVELLAQGERSVDEVAGEIGQSVANTSHHLRTLARAGLLTSRREGTHVHYRLASDAVLELWWAMREVAVAQVDDLDDLARSYLGDRADVATIDRAELLARLDRGEVVVVDVRPPAEYAAGHIVGAIHVPPEQLDLIDELLGDQPTDREVVAYCRGPYCVYADEAVRRLQRHGRRAARLDEGLPEWRRAGGPVAV
ncbi:ArsR/SmtB family transcription factor [Nitriliruptor alkaliphilus]|uniref:ArsR/SmtB family transcription factor n=1 Tax=Nitriliruptor alkaliphilus TaxID=427918 RepID=UPI000697757E|nr:metalloregulator ArsR/SmtB family transcription factor [Nitriliruptor alkaliphilus]